jgi:hypothetical protein
MIFVRWPGALEVIEERRLVRLEAMHVEIAQG